MGQGQFEFTGRDTLADARAYLHAQLKLGTKCPCCDQLAKLYRYKCDSGMARALIHFYRLSGEGREWVHYSAATIKQTGQKIITLKYSLPRHWGLMEKAATVDARRKNTLGMWRPTELGRAFVEGRATVQRYALLYNDTCYGLVGPQVPIRHALGDLFDYDELMRGGR